MTDGQRSYEEDVKRRPLYQDGTPRGAWDDLSRVVQWSWEKDPFWSAQHDTGGPTQ